MGPVILKLIGMEFQDCDCNVSLLCYNFTIRTVESFYWEIQKPDF